MKAVTSANGAGQYFNIATGNIITLNDLLKTPHVIYESDFEVNYGEERKRGVKESSAVLDKAVSVLQ